MVDAQYTFIALPQFLFLSLFLHSYRSDHNTSRNQRSTAEILRHVRRVSEQNVSREDKVVENSNHFTGTSVCPKQTLLIRMAARFIQEAKCNIYRGKEDSKEMRELVKSDIRELALFRKSHFPRWKRLAFSTDNSTWKRNMGALDLRALTLHSQVLFR